MRYTARLSLALVTFSMAFALAEAILHLWPVELASGWLLDSDKRALDPDLIYVNPLHTRESYYRVQSGLPTLVTLGDSFTAGYPVPLARSYPSVLQRKLARAGLPTNVVNLGVGDSGPDQHLGLFEHYALRYVQPEIGRAHV